jgi:hypothetical protein
MRASWLSSRSSCQDGWMPSVKCQAGMALETATGAQGIVRLTAKWQGPMAASPISKFPIPA